MGIKKELTKQDKIKKEIDRLSKIYEDIEERKKQTVEGLIEECAFMRVTLAELRADIDANGVVDDMPQGAYSIKRESPYVKTYHTMLQRYTTANEKLLGLLPKEKAEVVQDDGFDDFVNGRDSD